MRIVEELMKCRAQSKLLRTCGFPSYDKFATIARKGTGARGS